jgi:hypothetical protein
MTARHISHIYGSVPGMGAAKPVLGRPSDEPATKTRKSRIIERACTIYTANGVMRGINVLRSQYGAYIKRKGHEIKVTKISDGSWIQKGKDIADLPMRDHPTELADSGLLSSPVREYKDFTRYAKTNKIRIDGKDMTIHPGRQRNLKSPVRDLTRQIEGKRLEAITPSYKNASEMGAGLAHDSPVLVSITQADGLSAQLRAERDAWLRTIGK